MRNPISEEQLIELATSSASLDRSPRSNWVENVSGPGGGLPRYVRKIARAIERTGKTLSTSIAIAISRIKVWAGGGGNVKADTRAKAAVALAQWEALKAKAGAKRVAATAEGMIFSDVSPAREVLLDRQWAEEGFGGWIVEYSEEEIVVEIYNPELDVYTLKSVAYSEFGDRYIFEDAEFLEDVIPSLDDLTPDEEADLMTYLETLNVSDEPEPEDSMGGIPADSGGASDGQAEEAS